MSRRIAPDSAAAGVMSRLMMAAALPAVFRHRDGASRALATALRMTAAGRMPDAERAWAARIEARRRLVPAAIAAAGPPERDTGEHLAEATSACQWMSLAPVWGRFLMRLVREFGPRSCLELGTGFGISTAYQAAALELAGEGGMVSLDVEGMTEIAAGGLSALGLDHRVELVGGRIEDTLEAALERAAPVDYALLDADHTQEGTMAEFDAIVPKLSEQAFVVLDDVNWTAGMRRAWRAIAGHERVSATIGLRRVGIAVVSGAARNHA